MKLSKDNVTLEIMVYIKIVFKSLTEKTTLILFMIYLTTRSSRNVILDVASFYLRTLVNKFIIPKK